MKTKLHNIKIVGRVTYGNGLGHRIGFPTANIEPTSSMEGVSDGVWAGYASVCGQSYIAVVNIGYRPSVTDKGSHRIEAHLVDFDHNIYGADISLQLLHHIRAEQKFPSLEALAQQIALDKEQTLRLLNPTDKTK